MSKCLRCGSILGDNGACVACGRSMDKILKELSPPGTVRGIMDGGTRSHGQRHKQYSTATTILVSGILIMIAVSGVAAGIFYGTFGRSRVSCVNGGVNYPSCNSCGTLATYSASTHLCNCTDETVNPPSCNRFCANNAINPPPPNATGAEAACDRCPDGRTVDFTGICPPQAIGEISAPTQFLSTMVIVPRVPSFIALILESSAAGLANESVQSSVCCE